MNETQIKKSQVDLEDLEIPGQTKRGTKNIIKL